MSRIFIITGKARRCRKEELWQLHHPRAGGRNRTLSLVRIWHTIWGYFPDKGRRICTGTPRLSVLELDPYMLMRRNIPISTGNIPIFPEVGAAIDWSGDLHDPGLRTFFPAQDPGPLSERATTGSRDCARETLFFKLRNCFRYVEKFCRRKNADQSTHAGCRFRYGWNCLTAVWMRSRLHKLQPRSLKIRQQTRPSGMHSERMVTGESDAPYVSESVSLSCGRVFINRTCRTIPQLYGELAGPEGI